MAASPHQVFHTQTRIQHVPATEDGVGPGIIGPQTFVHLWLLLMILGAVAVLAVSIPLPVYASGLAAVDPALTGWWELLT